MELSDARLYFISENDDDLQDEYEGILFETKQFILTKVPSTKLYQSKINRLLKIQSAFETLGGIQNSKEVIYAPISFPNSDEVLTIFNEFNRCFVEWKTQLMSGDSIADLITGMKYYLQLYADYARYWNIELKSDVHVILGKEKDPMELLHAIRTFNKAGFTRFEEIPFLGEDNVLVTEAKRLSLWLKQEDDGR